ncbi:coatomer subunit beta [Enteropsectra breve]|nr:coatomer subunit beta [Enteropsectra breve]
MPQTLYLKYDNQRVDEKMIINKPEEALKLLISQQLSGEDTTQSLHIVIRSILNKSDNNLKRLLYYYLETIADEKAIIIFVNQINKDLLSPNEYVRGIALKFVSRINNYDFASNFLRSIKDNITNKVAYVRACAFTALSTAALKFGIDIEEEVHAMLQKENSPAVLKIIFGTMDSLGIGYEDYLERDYPGEVTSLLIDKTESLDFLVSCLESRDSTVLYKASRKILRSLYRSKGELNMRECSNKSMHFNSVQDIKTICTENILRSLKDCQDFKHDFISYVQYVDSHFSEFLELLCPYNVAFSKAIIDMVLVRGETSQYVSLGDLLYRKYKELGNCTEGKKPFKLLLIESACILADSHRIFVEGFLKESLAAVLESDAELVYAHLRFIGACVAKEGKNKNEAIDFLIEHFSKIEQGKILRLIFDIFVAGISDAQYENLMDRLLEDIKEKASYLANETGVYAGEHIAMSICMMNKTEHKPKALAVLISLLNFDNKLVDPSSAVGITKCIRNMLNNVVFENEGNMPISFDGRGAQVTEALRFSLLNCEETVQDFEWDEELPKKNKTVQLSGLSDPLYVEAAVSYDEKIISVDLLVINQTEQNLNDISFDLVHSAHLKPIKRIESLSLQANSAATMCFDFLVGEGPMCFISGSCAFKYSDGQESSGFYLQNLGEIQIEMREFLAPMDIDFTKSWSFLEWENIYSITIPKKNLLWLVNKLAGFVNGRICHKQLIGNCIVSNIACCTNSNSPLLLNVCVGNDEASAVEIRIRSKSEQLVKGLNMSIGTYLKALV